MKRPGVWRIEARTSVERLNTELDLDLLESDEYETIGAMLLEHFQRVPEHGDAMVWAASQSAREPPRTARSRCPDPMSPLLEALANTRT